MTEDKTTASATVNLVCYGTRAVWANQLKMNGRTLRTAGRLSAASDHTLLTIALTAALRSITLADVAKMGTRRTSGKPRVFVLCSDASFLDGLKAKINRQSEPKFRAGRNFLLELARQLARFEIVFEHLERPFFALQNWAVQTVPDPRLIGVALSPSVVSSLA
jgi:hypothetical protein